MSDDFIPFNQSTPMKGKWQNRTQNQQNKSRYYQNNKYQNGNRGQHQQWGNNSHRNSSYGVSGSDSNSSFGRDRSNIDAYLHPSMLQDPWAHLRQKTNQ